MKMARLISILMILSEQEKISAPKLAEKFEVSVRTIYRDIDSLCMAGFPIQTETGLYGGFKLMEGFKKNKQYFSMEDLFSLWSALSNIPKEFVETSPTVGCTLEKLKALIPKERREQMENRVEQIVIDSSPWTNSGAVQPNFAKLQLAMTQSKLVTFSYQDRKGHKTLRRIEPYQLIFKEISWYINGYCLDRQEYRLFKLSRIENLEISENSFQFRGFQSAKLGEKKWEKKEFTTLHIKFHFLIKDQLTERFSLKNIRKLEGEEDWYEADFSFMKDEFGYRILLGFGLLCECLAPEDVRIELGKRIKALAKVYE